MRPFEIALLTVVAVVGVRWLLRPGSAAHRLDAILPVAGVALAVAQIGLEGARWSMVPAYVFALSWLLSLPARRRARSPAARTGWRRLLVSVARAAAVLVPLSAALVLPALFPVFDMPRPTGRFQVGTTRLSFRDDSRPETFTPDPNDRRELAVQVWYPGEPAREARALPLWTEAGTLGPLLAGFIKMPGFIFHQLALVRSNSFAELPVAAAQARYPVIVFSHGYPPGFAQQNTTQMEELASHGYIVFSIAHTHEALAAFFPGGRVVPYSVAQVDAADAEALNAGSVQAYVNERDPAKREPLLRRLLATLPLRQASLRLWTEDTSFVVDCLERLDRGEAPGRFGGRLDLSRLGVMGMSFGGATAGQFCLVDARCAAAVNLDGLQFGDVIDGVVKRPFLMMYSEGADGMNDFMLDRVEAPSYRLVVRGTTHYDFTDLSLISPLFRMMGLLGPIGGERASRVVSAYVLAFFDRYLKGEPQPLLDGPSAEFPEVEFARGGPGRLTRRGP